MGGERRASRWTATTWSHPAKSSNSAWDGKRIRAFGARNEIIAFQVIVEADGAGIDKLSARLPALVRKGGGAVITYGSPIQIRPATPAVQFSCSPLLYERGEANGRLVDLSARIAICSAQPDGLEARSTRS